MSEHPFIRRFEAFKRRLRSRCRNLVLFEPTSIDEVLVSETVEPDEYVVTRENRWPHPREHDYEDMYPVDIFDGEAFGKLYGGGLSSPAEMEHKTASILDYTGEARQFYLRRLLQRLVDHALRGTRTKIILLASSIGLTRRHALDYGSPLHGRITARLRLGPMSFVDVRGGSTRAILGECSRRPTGSRAASPYITGG